MSQPVVQGHHHEPGSHILGVDGDVFGDRQREGLGGPRWGREGVVQALWN